MNGFDPVIALNKHIALLTLLTEAEQEVKVIKGLVLPIAKMAGRHLRQKLEQSKSTMWENKMRVQDVPISDRQYQYWLFNRREVYEVSPDTVKFHVRMLLTELENEVRSLE